MSKRDKSIETKKLIKFPELEQDGGVDGEWLLKGMGFILGMMHIF